MNGFLLILLNLYIPPFYESKNIVNIWIEQNYLIKQHIFISLLSVNEESDF